jgi:site-specific recombinase XerD
MKTTNKGRKFAAETLTQSEVERLITSCNGGSSGTRNKALLTIMYRTGLRVSEALALKPSDIDGSTLTVLKGKGGKRRVVGLDAWAIAALDAWLAVRPKGKTLFCTLSGEKLLTSYIRGLLKRLARKAGIEKRCNPHSLRHSFATMAMMQLPLPVLSQALGHSALSTTQIYTHKLNPRLVVDAMRQLVRE